MSRTGRAVVLVILGTWMAIATEDTRWPLARRMNQLEGELRQIRRTTTSGSGAVYSSTWPVSARKIRAVIEPSDAERISQAFDPSMRNPPTQELRYAAHASFTPPGERIPALDPDGIKGFRTLEAVRQICLDHYMAGRQLARMDIEDSHPEWRNDELLSMMASNAVYYLFHHPYERTTDIPRPYRFDDMDSASCLISQDGEVALVVFRLRSHADTGGISWIGVKLVRASHPAASQSAFILCPWIAVDERIWSEKSSLSHESLLNWSEAADH